MTLMSTVTQTQLYRTKDFHGLKFAANLQRALFFRIFQVSRGPFLEFPIINGPGKLSPFALKIEVSIVLHLA